MHEVEQRLKEKTFRCFEPKMVIEEKQVIMLYQGDAGFETQDAKAVGPKHRCILDVDGWHYISSELVA